MVGVPAGQDDIGSGGYFVCGDVIVAYYPDYSAAELYAFEVIDDNTINVKELLAISQGGTRELGETETFSRNRTGS